MAFSKANRYRMECQLVYHFLRAILHPARQEIIKKLRKVGSCKVKELSKNHPICRATFSDHLKLLRKEGIIIPRESYPHTYYKLDIKKLKEVKKIINKFFDDLEL